MPNIGGPCQRRTRNSDFRARVAYTIEAVDHLPAAVMLSVQRNEPAGIFAHCQPNIRARFSKES